MFAQRLLYIHTSRTVRVITVAKATSCRSLPGVVMYLKGIYITLETHPPTRPKTGRYYVPLDSFASLPTGGRVGVSVSRCQSSLPPSRLLRSSGFVGASRVSGLRPIGWPPPLPHLRLNPPLLMKMSDIKLLPTAFIMAYRPTGMGRPPLPAVSAGLRSGRLSLARQQFHAEHFQRRSVNRRRKPPPGGRGPRLKIASLAGLNRPAPRQNCRLRFLCSPKCRRCCYEQWPPS